MSESEGLEGADPERDDEVEKYVELIGAAWSKSVEHILDAGRWAFDASEKLGLKKRQALQKRLGMEDWTFSRLRAIGEALPTLQRVCGIDRLPPNYTAIKAISDLAEDEDELKRAMSEGAIHPGANRDTIKAWRDNKAGKPAQPRKPDRSKLLVARVYATKPEHLEVRPSLTDLTPTHEVEWIQSETRKTSFVRRRAIEEVRNYLGVPSLADNFIVDRGWEVDDVKIRKTDDLGKIRKVFRTLGIPEKFESILDEYGSPN